MKMAKKVLAVLLSVLFVVGVFTACSSNSGDTKKKEDTTNSATSKLKVGFIFLHDKNSTYDLNFIKAADAACEKLGITGTRAHTEGLANYHNAFASIYEGRYLAGIAAGMKLNEMIEKGEFKKDEAKMGYVGAFTYAEVISGYTSFFLGARSVCPSVTMEVTFTGSWYDEAAEKEAANKLIKDGCKLISQHADSMGAPTACESAGVPNVSYNGSTISACPNTFIVSSRINWEPYYEYAIKCVAEGKTIDADWTGTLSTGSVELTDVNTKAAAAGTQEAIDAAKKKLEDGSLHVFDTSAFTVNGKKLDSYKADVDTDAKYTPDTEVVKDGYFAESTARSAPYFDVQIDGIKLLDKKQ